MSIKSKDELVRIQKSGALLGELLYELAKQCKVGTNIWELELFARKFLSEHHAQPAFLGYKPEGATRAYPAALCISLNETVVHGVPKKYIVKSGDVVKIDAGVLYEGMYTDSATTVMVGKVSSRTRELVRATYRALEDAIQVTRVGNTLGDIGYVIEKRARASRVYVLKALTGHGVGYELHEDPVVYNYGNKHEGMKLHEGMVIAIEPMFSLSTQHIIQKSDESYASADGSMTAHFEHTLIITKSKPIIATQFKKS